MAAKKLGPTGGEGGIPFDHYQVPAGAKLREIRLLTNRFVNAIQLIYTDADGSISDLAPVGGMSGELQVFTLADDEYLTGVSGRCGWYLDSLRLHTNKRESMTYGGAGGTEEFHFDAPAGSEICGFFGSADWYIDSLGVITRPRKQKSKARKTAKNGSAKSTTKPGRKRAAKKPDLQIVEGIGPKIAQILHDAGIPDLESLAKTATDNLNAILEKAGSRYRIHDPETWPEQAKLAAKEAWDALEKLQNQLKGGRRS